MNTPLERRYDRFLRASVVCMTVEQDTFEEQVNKNVVKELALDRQKRTASCRLLPLYSKRLKQI